MTLTLNDPSLFRADAFVGGNWVPATDGAGISVTDPATGAVIATVPSLDTAAIEQATPTSPWHPISAPEMDARCL